MTTTKKMIIIGAILAGAGMGICVMAMAIVGFDISKLSTGKTVTQHIEIDEDFNDIMIDVHTEDIIIKRSADGKNSVTIEASEGMEPTVDTDNGTLTVASPDRNISIWNTGFFMISPDVTISLADDDYGKLSAVLTTADMKITDDVTFESVDIEVTTGDIDISSNVAGAVDIRTTTGDIRMSDTVAGSMKIAVTTGDIRMENSVIEGDLDIAAVTGDVNFAGIDAANISVTTNTGDVEGSILSDKIFVTETGVGDVKVPDTADGGKCTVTTNTGDIDLTIRE